MRTNQLSKRADALAANEGIQIVVQRALVARRNAVCSLVRVELQTRNILAGGVVGIQILRERLQANLGFRLPLFVSSQRRLAR